MALVASHEYSSRLLDGYGGLLADSELLSIGAREANSFAGA